jgi:hypothetical protein
MPPVGLVGVGLTLWCFGDRRTRTLREVVDRIAALLEAHRILYSIEAGDHAGNDVLVVRHPDW